MELSYRKVSKSFKGLGSKVTHEFFYDVTTIDIGRYKGQTVAIKQCPTLGLTKEAQIHQVVNSYWQSQGSEHVIKFISRIVDEDGSVSILMEGVEDLRGIILGQPSVGLTLRQFSLHSPPISLRKSVNFFRQVLLGLHHIHSCGVIHHDLKTDNILVTQNPSGNGQILKICDFGSAEFVDKEGYGDPSHRGAGTYNNFAPEQSRDSVVPITRKLDVYALSAIGWTIFGTGWRPGRPDTSKVTPIALCELFRQCQDSNPELRPSTEQLLRETSSDLLDYCTYEDRIKDRRKLINDALALCKTNGMNPPPELLDYDTELKKLEGTDPLNT